MTVDYPTWWKEKERPQTPDDNIPFTYPSWYVWTGDWFELDGDHTYLVDWNLNEESVVVDVGAYRGVWVSWMIPRYPCHYWCIEPSPYSFEALKKTVGDYKKAHLFNFALWTGDGKGTLSDIGRDGANLFGSLEPRASVELVDAKRFFDKNNLQRVDLFSMNVEGSEFYLLPYFVSTGLILRIENLILQWHVSEDNPAMRLWRIREMLAKTHKMVWNGGAWECWTKKGQQ